MRELQLTEMEDTASHEVNCPECKEAFPVKFLDLDESPYQPVGCDTCSNILAMPTLDPLIIYLQNKHGDETPEFHGAVSRALAPCPCGGSFRFFDDRRHCPLCKGAIKEVQIMGQVKGIRPPKRAVLSKLIFTKNDTWKNLDFLREAIESEARAYEANPTTSKEGHPEAGWLAKEIYDRYFRKITYEKLTEIMPRRTDLFGFNHRIYHDHGGAKGPWWKFWKEEVLFPDKCGIVFDIDQKTFKCSACGESFPATSVS